MHRWRWRRKIFFEWKSVRSAVEDPRPGPGPGCTPSIDRGAPFPLPLLQKKSSSLSPKPEAAPPRPSSSAGPFRSSSRPHLPLRDLAERVQNFRWSDRERRRPDARRVRDGVRDGGGRRHRRRLADAARVRVVLAGVMVDDERDDLGRVLASEDLVELDVRIQDAPGALVHDALLEEGVADALQDAAADLALDSGLPDRLAAVVDRDDLLHGDDAGLDVHDDLGELRAEEPRVCAVVVLRAVARRDERLARETGADLPEVRRLALRREDTVRERDLRGRRAEEPRRDVEELLLRVDGSRANGRDQRARRDGAARGGPERVARVTDLHVDLRDREAELLGDDHRDRRPHAAPDVLHAVFGLDGSVAVNPDDHLRARRGLGCAAAVWYTFVAQ